MHEHPNHIIPIFLTFVVSFVLIGVGPNSSLAGLSLAILLYAAISLWRPGEPPILLLLVAMQWLQASVKIFWANSNGVNINELAHFDDSIEVSTFLTLIGLLLLTIGLQLGLGRGKDIVGLPVRVIASQLPANLWIKWYVIALLGSLLAGELGREIPSLSQPLLAVANLKWAFYFMLTCAAFCNSKSLLQFWFVAFAVELLLSTGGYFSDFKSVFVFSALGLAAVSVRLNLTRIILLTAISASAIYIAILWTAIKPDYRDFVSGGQTAQIVEVDYATRMSKLLELGRNVDYSEMKRSTELFLKRLAYVDYFAAAIAYVPNTVDHTLGSIWWDALSRPFTPRLLFPDKTPIDDSERTSQFTGLSISGAETGTSISIGYVGESYIDFGRYGMMLPIFLLGLMLGRFYRWIALESSVQGILGMGLACSALTIFSFVEISITKALGGFFVAFLVIFIFSRLAIIFLRPLIAFKEASRAGYARSALDTHQTIR